MRYLPSILAVLLLPVGALAGRAESLPKSALAVVQQVHDNSAKKDLSSLSQLMAREFTWSFGGDASAEQALEEWKKHPDILAKLSRATAGPCEAVSGDIIQCPKGSRLGYRAGFKQLSEGWRMVYFVEGD